jgi:hypothetical protein
MKDSPRSVNELFGSLKNGSLGDIFDTLVDKKPVEEAKVEEAKKKPQWPNVRIRR